MENLPFKDRADAIKRMSDDIAAAPILSRMAMATDLVAAAADLVSDMAAHLDQMTPYIDEADAPDAFGADQSDYAQS